MKPGEVPETVRSQVGRDLYAETNAVRREIKEIAARVAGMRAACRFQPDALVNLHTEVEENITLVFRHLEDASMRCGKVLQALDGGVSVYDRLTVVETGADSGKDRWLHMCPGLGGRGLALFIDECTECHATRPVEEASHGGA